MQMSTNIANGLKSNNYRLWWESSLSFASKTISPLFADLSSTTLV